MFFTFPDMPLIAQCLWGSFSLKASSITCSSPWGKKNQFFECQQQYSCLCLLLVLLITLSHWISSVHSPYTRESLNENLFVNPVQTTQYGICSLCYTGTTLWNSFWTSLPINVKQITPFFRFRQNIKNSMTNEFYEKNYMINGYNNVIDS